MQANVGQVRWKSAQECSKRTSEQSEQKQVCRGSCVASLSSALRRVQSSSSLDHLFVKYHVGKCYAHFLRLKMTPHTCLFAWNLSLWVIFHQFYLLSMPPSCRLLAQGQCGQTHFCTQNKGVSSSGKIVIKKKLFNPLRMLPGVTPFTLPESGVASLRPGLDSVEAPSVAPCALTEGERPLIMSHRSRFTAGDGGH